MDIGHVYANQLPTPWISIKYNRYGVAIFLYPLTFK